MKCRQALCKECNIIILDDVLEGFDMIEMFEFKGKKFFAFEKAKSLVESKFGSNNCVVVETKNYDLTTPANCRNNNKDRAEWANKVILDLTSGKREDIGRDYVEAYNFAYIKFALNREGKSFAVVNGLSSFHWKYPSDVEFYDINKVNKPKLKNTFDNKLEWDKEKIILVKSDNPRNREEAKSNEKSIQSLLGTFD